MVSEPNKVVEDYQEQVQIEIKIGNTGISIGHQACWAPMKTGNDQEQVVVILPASFGFMPPEQVLKKVTIYFGIPY